MIRVAIPTSDKLYIRVREEAISRAVFITHFDKMADGQPGPLEASGMVGVGDATTDDDAASHMCRARRQAWC